LEVMIAGIEGTIIKLYAKPIINMPTMII